MIVPIIPQSAAAVAQHYDELDPIHREIWGHHVHHGWVTGGETPEEAVEALVDLLADRLASSLANMFAISAAAMAPRHSGSRNGTA